MIMAIYSLYDIAISDEKTIVTIENKLWFYAVRFVQHIYYRADRRFYRYEHMFH